MSDPEETWAHITKQGRPVISGAYIVKWSNELAAVVVELSSKRCDVLSINSRSDEHVVIDFAPTPESLRLDIEAEQGSVTSLELTGFYGWKVWCHEVGKSYLSLCLTRD